MSLFGALEDIFEKYIEGFFRKKFSGDLQPVEIAKKLVREMENSRSVSVAKMYVPNRYMVYVAEPDYNRLSSYWQAIREELAHFLLDEAAKKGFAMVGQPIIDLFTTGDIDPGNFSVVSEFTEPIVDDADAAPDFSTKQENVGKQENTKVFQRVSMDLSGRKTPLATLTVIAGIDTGAAVDIAGQRVNIGRRPGNEFCLRDMNVSRLHAYIVWEEDSHVIYDAKSLNGTYVNDQRITRKILKSGDKIKMGNTILIYEVK